MKVHQDKTVDNLFSLSIPSPPFNSLIQYKNIENINYWVYKNGVVHANELLHECVPYKSALPGLTA